MYLLAPVLAAFALAAISLAQKVPQNLHAASSLGTLPVLGSQL
jgi:hypothetical protein